jgi:hypothetical protein
MTFKECACHVFAIDGYVDKTKAETTNAKYDGM